MTHDTYREHNNMNMETCRSHVMTPVNVAILFLAGSFGPEAHWVFPDAITFLYFIFTFYKTKNRTY